MSKVNPTPKEEKTEKTQEVKVPIVPLPDILKKRSMFSGGSQFGSRGPLNKFTPKTYRITQHKGG